VTVTASVSSGGAPLANAAVSFTITKANGSVLTSSATSGANGVATHKFRLNKRDPVGSYQAKANAAMGGVSANATTSFTVQ
jgi:uncharacterized protein YfaS (alpha-2-macroglobulin family)